MNIKAVAGNKTRLVVAYANVDLMAADYAWIAAATFNISKNF